MTTYTYRGHEITRTNTTTGGSDGKPLRHLFSISKPVYASPADVTDLGKAYRLGLTSIAACKRHIADTLDYEE